MQGRYEIISLSGSVILSENNGSHNRSSNLIVSLAGPDGRVMGGGVVNLIAATPVQVLLSFLIQKYLFPSILWLPFPEPIFLCNQQVIVGSFISETKKSASVPAPQMMSFGAAATVPSPPSQRVSSESSDENGNNTLNREPVLYNSAGQQPIHNMQMYQLWAGQNQQ